MGLLPHLWLGAAAPACNTEDMCALLAAVLPTFIGIAERIHNDLPEPEGPQDSLEETRSFHLGFKADTFNLNAVLVQWDPTETVQGLSTDESEVKKHLTRILDQLENRFVSQKGEAGPAFSRLGFNYNRDEVYPKLSALRRILPDEDASDESFWIDINRVIRIYTKNAGKRERLLSSINQALVFFYSLRPHTTESDSPCPVRFSDSPLRHIRRFTKALFDVVQANWGCQCLINAPHVSRKTRLNLTQHQRFETAPARGTGLPSGKASFRILFPTSSHDIEWQETEITVNSRGNIDACQEEVQDGVCGIIRGARLGTRPRLVVYDRRLWQLRSEAERNRWSPPRVRDAEFKTLGDLFRVNQKTQESLLSSIDGKDRLVLSFILATSLLHFFSGPWLQASLDSDNICFLVSYQRSSPDITKPYFTASCSSSTRAARSEELSQPHRFPDILSLGIVLLEIARGSPIDFKEGQDRCVVALECMDKWTKLCRTSRYRTVPDGLCRAISACIDPMEHGNSMLDKAYVNDFEIRTYIFERILYPLEDALSTAYEIPLSTLHADVPLVKKANRTRSFSREDGSQQESREAADEWLDHLGGVHDLFYECESRCQRRLGEEATKAARVKVAVLDTGLQLPGALRENYEDEGRISFRHSGAFVPVTGETSTHGWNVDRDGHGSRVGQIVLQVAPAADLHVAKVFETRDDLADPHRAEQAHRRIAEAIDRATGEWEVDMIVMSFGFDEPIPLIREAMERASRAHKPPLFFAATRNEGAHKRMAWPAKDISVIGVSSTAGNGDASRFNPSEEDAYPVLHAFGEGVPVKAFAPGDPDSHVTKYVYGTSYATATAAGLAANLLGCARMIVEASSPEDRAVYGHVPADLQRMGGMLAVLRQRMRRRHECGLKSLLPWDFLKVELLEGNRILEDISSSLRTG